MKRIIDLLEASPVIPAIKKEEEVEEVLKSESEVVFILTSNIFNIKNIVKKLQENGKVVFVHVDLIEGLSQSIHAVDYVSEVVEANGIISTKNNLIRYAKKKNIMVIQRCFILDSISLKNCLKYTKENRPDAIEILPGLMPKIIKKVVGNLGIPVIAGGLISDKEDIMNALNAGAHGISTTDKKLFNI